MGQYNFTDPSGRDLASTIALKAMQGYLIGDQRRYNAQLAARDQSYKMQSAQQLGDIQLRNQEAERKQIIDAQTAEHKQKLQDERKQHIYELLFGDDKAKNAEAEAYATAKGRLRAEAQYGKSTKRADTPDFEDYMKKVKEDYPDAAPEWQRNVADIWTRTGDRQAAFTLAGHPTPKSEKAPRSEADILSDKTKIVNAWTDEGTSPTKDPQRDEQLAEIMARNNVNQNQGMKVLDAADTAASASKHFGIDPNQKVFDPDLLHQAIGKDVGFDGPQSITDLASMDGVDKKGIIAIIQKYLGLSLGAAYNKAMNGNPVGNGR